jgi:hypothetical protein
MNMYRHAPSVMAFVRDQLVIGKNLMAEWDKVLSIACREHVVWSENELLAELYTRGVKGPFHRPDGTSYVKGVGIEEDTPIGGATETW